MIAQVDTEYFKRKPFSAYRRIISRIFFEGRPITTKGRWFNKIVFTLFNIEILLPQTQKVIKPIFIIGTGRSGTTILGTLLSIHEDVGFLSEPKAVWHAVHSGEDVSGNYTLGPARYRLSEEDASQEVVDRAHRLFGFYLTMVKANRIIDKNPELVFRIPFVKKIFPDAKFIFLVRNGWDTVKSIVNYSVRDGKNVNGEIHDWWGVNNRKWRIMLDELVANDKDLSSELQTIQSFTSHKDMATVEWIVTMKEGLKNLNEYPNTVMLQRYEDFATYPRINLEKMLSFCDLDAYDDLLSYAELRLHEAPKYERFEVNPFLRKSFHSILDQLGY